MAGSIHLAIQMLQNHRVDSTMRVLFLTVDQVALMQQDLQELTQPAADNVILVSQYNNQPSLGIPVNLPFSFLQEFSDRLQGDKGFRALWQNQLQIESDSAHMRYQLQPIFLPHLALDIDTPQQFAALKDQYQLSIAS